MMRIADALVSQILADEAAALLLGDRVYKDLIPEGIANPCASYTTLDDLPKLGMRTNRQASVQMKLFGDSGSSVSSVADAVISAVVSDKYNPTISQWTVGTDKHSVSLCLLADNVPSHDPDTGEEMVLLQFEIHYTTGG